jgi:DNA-binding MarR family transcriptional regulator
MPTTPALALDRFVPFRLSVLSNTVSTAIAAAYERRFGLSIPEWRVMAVLAASPGLSAAEVAQRTAMDKVAVSRAVASLLASRRIARRTSTGDRRRTQLRLAAAGERVYAQVVPFALDYERRLLHPLGRTDRAALERLLRKLMARAAQLERPPA